MIFLNIVSVESAIEFGVELFQGIILREKIYDKTVFFKHQKQRIVDDTSLEY